jgi:hypothetical protein
MPQVTIKKGIPDVNSPSFYSPAYKETWEKEAAKMGFESDSPAMRLQQEAIKVIQANHRDIERLNEMKQATLKAYSRNEALVKISDFASKAHERIAKRSSEFEEKALNFTNEVRSRVEGDIQSTARNSRNEDRILSYLLNEKPSKRMPFLREALNKKHKESLSAVVANPAFLSGISEDDQAFVRKQFVQKVYSEDHKAIERASKLQGHVGRGFQAFQANLSDVVDKPEFKAAKQKIEQAKKVASFD